MGNKSSTKPHRALSFASRSGHNRLRTETLKNRVESPELAIYASVADVLQHVWQKLEADSEITQRVTHAFYTRFFSEHPQYKAYFIRKTDDETPDIESQAPRLLSMVSVLIKHTKDTSSLKHHMTKLGRFHAAKRIPPEAFDHFISAFIETLRTEFGPAFTPRDEFAWGELMRLCSRIMITEIEHLNAGSDSEVSMTRTESLMTEVSSLSEVPFQIFLANKKARDWFHLFLAASWSEESMLFLEAFRKLEALQPGPELQSSADSILSLYIDPNGARPINISHRQLLDCAEVAEVADFKSNTFVFKDGEMDDRFKKLDGVPTIRAVFGGAVDEVSSLLCHNFYDLFLKSDFAFEFARAVCRKNPNKSLRDLVEARAA